MIENNLLLHTFRKKQNDNIDDFIDSQNNPQFMQKKFKSQCHFLHIFAYQVRWEI